MSSVFIRKKKDNYYVVVKLDDGTEKSYSVRKELNLKRKAKKSEANSLKLIKENELAAGGLISSEGLLTSQYFEKWLEIKEPTIEEDTTAKSYLNCINTHIIPRIGNYPLDKLNNLAVQVCINGIVSDGKIRSALYAHMIMKQAFDKAVTWKLINSNPAESIDLPKYQPKEKIIWTDEQTAIFLDEIPKHRLYPFYVLTMSAGERSGEGLGLPWPNLDFARDCMVITQTLLPNRKIKPKPKTPKGFRTIYLDKEAMEVLREHRKAQIEELMLLGVRNEDNLVFLTSKGTPYSQRNVLRHFQGLCKKLDLPIINIHSLRHLQVYWLLKAGADWKTIQDRLGHKRISTTMDIYGHLDTEMQKDAADKIGAKKQSILKKA